MIEAKILYGFLDKLAKETQRELEEGGSLTKQNVIPFLMREQFEKISRIEDEFATSQDLYDFKQFSIEKFDKVDKMFDRMEKKINGLYGLVILGFTVLGYLLKVSG